MSDFPHPPQHRPPEKPQRHALTWTLLIVGGVLALCGGLSLCVGASTGSSGDSMDSMSGDPVAMGTYVFLRLACPLFGLVLMAIGGYFALRRR